MREDFTKNLSAQFKQTKQSTVSGSGNASSKAFLLSLLMKNIPFRKIFWITNRFAEAQEIKETLPQWIDNPVFFLTNIILGETRQENIAGLLGQLKNLNSQIFILTKDDFSSPFPTLDEVEEHKFTLMEGASFDLIYLINILIEMGYRNADENILKLGEYSHKGNILNIFPFNAVSSFKIEFDDDQVAQIFPLDIEQKKLLLPVKELALYPLRFSSRTGELKNFLQENDLVITDELDEELIFAQEKTPFFNLKLNSFPEENEEHFHLRFLSVLKFQNGLDFVLDVREKINQGWQVIVATRRLQELQNILKDKGIVSEVLTDDFNLDNIKNASVFLLHYGSAKNFPPAFQNPRFKSMFLTDNEIFGFYRGNKAMVQEKIYLEFIASLKAGDFIVHINHGIGRFLGIEQHTVDEITREYLKIGYAENDKLFVPIDQADKVSKFIGVGDEEPKLSRLGSVEWNTITKKAKLETQQIAKELLEIFAKRAAAIGFKYKEEAEQARFESTFAYEETPGQIKAIDDVKRDMESDKPMDRLICGDVGFGKTEVALRAAFKAVRNNKQVVMISPITILADQHFHTFQKRMKDFYIRVEMLSRFRTAREQKEIVKKIENGEIDIIIGTHRILQPDVKFKNLGLVIIDEEQRFGVKQKENLKSLRASIDILTLTATPIPRTLNMSLHNLRDITTITTPPPGRLPIITEVRHFNLILIREAILRELSRGGQIYFLHNRVQTINGIAERLRALVPEARFGVAHGQLDSGDLEERILDFKNHKFDVLVSSAIIENGIDLPNANTLIVDNAERFGLSQLYQLRGRVGRSKKQAYAYFLYHTKQLKLDAKKRLRAIIEASELGSGFQIAMRDLEIRGAGDILGAKQHGTINVVGVNHFLRLLNKAVEDLKSGKADKPEGEEEVEVTIEIPLSAYIPDLFIPDMREKIKIYQKLSSLDNVNILNSYHEELIEEYGELPKEMLNLFKVLHLKILAKKANLINVKITNVNHTEKQVELLMSAKIKPKQILKVIEYNPKWLISGSKLKINLKDLGFSWFEELKKSIEVLG